MYEVSQEEPTEEFYSAWKAAVQHFQKIGHGGIYWLRSNLYRPIAEHLSFQFGNQLFFVYVEVGGLPPIGGRIQNFLRVASQATAIPCILKMEQKLGTFVPVNSGWGLIHATSGFEVNPLDLVSDELIVMSDWELHDFAIQIVRETLENDGKNVIEWQPSPQIDPSLWFEEKGERYWVVVRGYRLINDRPNIPDFEKLKRFYSRWSDGGFYAPVFVKSADDPFDPLAPNYSYPLYRGHELMAKFQGIERV